METRSKATAQSDCSSDHEVDQTIAKGFETQCNLSDGSQHQEFPPSNDPEIVFNYNHQGKSDFDRHESARRGYKPPSRTNSLDRKSKEALGLDQMLDQMMCSSGFVASLTQKESRCEGRERLDQVRTN